MCLVRLDHLFGVHRRVPADGVPIEVPQQLGGDVKRRAAVDGIHREDTSEVVRRERDRCAVPVAQVQRLRNPPQQLVREVVVHDAQKALVPALEQEGHRQLLTTLRNVGSTRK